MTRRNHNHQPFGGMNAHQAPIIGRDAEAAQIAIQQGINQMSSGMYIRAASEILVSSKGEVTSSDMRELAKDCHQAAHDYFIGLGIIESN